MDYKFFAQIVFGSILGFVLGIMGIDCIKNPLKFWIPAIVGNGLFAGFLHYFV